MEEKDYFNMSEDQLIELIQNEEINEDDILKLMEEGRIKPETIIQKLYDPYDEMSAKQKEEANVIFAAIVNKLSDDEKIEIIKGLSFDENKATLGYTLREDEKKIEALSLIEDESQKARVIRRIKEDSDKIGLLESIKDDYAKSEIILSLKDDKNKVAMLPKVKIDYFKVPIIQSLKEDEDKIGLLSEIKSENIKTSIIISFNEDSNKKAQLSQIKDEKNKGRIIASFDEDTIIGFLSNIEDERQKIKIVLSLTEGSKKINVFKDIGINSSGKYNSFGLPEEMTIGMEIESEGEQHDVILSAKKINNWETKYDGSLRKGVECVSPVMKDNETDIESIYMICSILQKEGLEISDRCGGHVHIGAHTLTSAEAYKNLMEMWCNTEVPLYLISNELGQVPRDGLATYALPYTPKLLDSLDKETVEIQTEEDLDKLVSYLKEIQDTRYSSINLYNVNYNQDKNTVEFRCPNGSINPDSWIENARLFGRMVEMAQKTAEIEFKDASERTEEEKVKLGLLESLKIDDLSDKQKLELLLEILFTEEEKAVYREKYEINSYMFEQLPEYEEFLKRKDNRIVDLNDPKKHKKEEMEEIAKEEKLSDIESAMQESLKEGRDDSEQEIDGEDKGE